MKAYEAGGGQASEVVVIEAPGSFELPVLCHVAAESGKFAGIVALGCIIKGETSHDQHLASAVVHGLVNVSLLTGVPVSLGVLTVNNPRQARERAGGKQGNKGAEAMDALLMTMNQIERLEGTRSGSRERRAVTRVLPDKATARPRSGRDAR